MSRRFHFVIFKPNFVIQNVKGNQNVTYFISFVNLINKEITF